jgi:predicted nucleic-acid-binding protein
VFVLESFYEHPREDIAATLKKLIASPGVEIRDAAVFLDALERYARTRRHFVDCVIAATAAAEGVPIATFDEGFRKFNDVSVKTD